MSVLRATTYLCLAIAGDPSADISLTRTLDSAMRLR
jgi:hypothetical protein